MILKLNETESLDLKYSFRSSIYFETISGHNLDLNNLTGNDLMILFYAVFVASLQKEKKPIVDMIQFMDIIDENGGERCIYNFSKWYVEQIQIQWQLEEDPEEKTNTDVKGKKTYASKKKKP